MGTRACVAIGNLKHWEGVYTHWDGYPSGVGQDAFDLLQSKNGKEKFKESIKNHPGGWSSYLEKCYCHDEYFANRDGSSAKDSPHYRDNAPNGQMTNETADALFIEYVYILDEEKGRFYVLESVEDKENGGYKHTQMYDLSLAQDSVPWE